MDNQVDNLLVLLVMNSHLGKTAVRTQGWLRIIHRVVFSGKTVAKFDEIKVLCPQDDLWIIEISNFIRVFINRLWMDFTGLWMLHLF